jgi:virginiamycin B lyase
VLPARPAVALSPPDIFWGNEFGDSIGIAAIDGSGANQSFISGPSIVCGVAVDGEHVYWVNSSGGNTIGIANLDGTGVNQDFISAVAGWVAVNSEHIYWSTGSNTIARANLDASGVKLNFITGADLPGCVAVDGQHIYWSNVNGSSIGRANLDGTGVNQNFITGASTPEGVAVDNQHIYWGNFDSTIGEANLDGSDVNQSLIPADGVRGIAVDGQHVYWTDQTNNQIGEANLDGTGVNASFITGANTPCGVAVSVPVAQVTFATPAAFGTTPQGTLSAPVTLTVSNSGERNLTISGLTLAGSDPGDFIVSPGGCMGPVAPGESCQLTVNFASRRRGPAPRRWRSQRTTMPIARSRFRCRARPGVCRKADRGRRGTRALQARGGRRVRRGRSS